MDFINWLVQINKYLEESYLFRTFKFGIGFYLVIITLAVILMLYHTAKMYWIILIHGQEHPRVSKSKFQRRWEKAQSRMQTESSNEWKVAILEAADMLNEVLLTVGYKSGDTLGQRLDTLHTYQLDNLSEVKEANKIKNHIVQNDAFELTKEEAQQTFEAFHKAMHFFEAID